MEKEKLVEAFLGALLERVIILAIEYGSVATKVLFTTVLAYAGAHVGGSIT